MILIMTYSFTDIPSPLEESAYHRILKNVVAKLSSLEGVEAVYQIGGIASPGISDLDLVVVFRDDFVCLYNLHDELSDEEKYLFIHKLFGCSAKYFHESSRYSFFHNFTLLAGSDIKREEKLNELETSTIKSQIALEYMVKMYANIIVQKEYSVLQIRSLLLHGKALNFDLEFLGVDAITLQESVNELLSIRKNWFKATDGKAQIELWFKQFVILFPEILDSILKVRGLYLPEIETKKIAKNISLHRGASLSHVRRGIVLPSFPVSLLGKKYFRLQNKFNSFEILLPVRENEPPEALTKYFAFQSKQKEYNKKHLPHFYPLASSLLA